MKKIILQTGVISLGVYLILGSSPTPGPTPPPSAASLSTPANFTATPAYKSVIVSWNTVSSADSYEICTATETISNFDNCTSYANGALSNTVNNSAVINPLTAGQPYYFSVIAKAASGVSSTASATASATPTLGLNDTGISECGSGSANQLSCPILNYPNQDAEHGLDSQSPSSVDGDAGFNFAKLDSNGNPLPASANTWSCVKDNVTGLIWESKTSFNRDDRFTWYSDDSSNNAGSSGSQNGGDNTCSGYDASDSTSYCNTQAYITRVNFGSHCGMTNWRLPARHELNSIVNYDSVTPSIDLAYFNHTQSELYWSDTPSFSSSTASEFVWATNFNYGGSAKHNKQDSLRVRLVSGGQ